MLGLVLLAALAGQLATAAASLSVGYAFNSQLPPVARVDHAYNFVLSNETFSSSESAWQDLDVNVTGAPSWLSFDASTWTFSGTPSDVGSGSVTFDINASDGDGGSTSDTAVLVVTNATAPTIHSPLSEQLAMLGSLDGSGGIILLGDEDFEVTFAEDTFTTADGSDPDKYYGVSSDFSPLPPWISFDSSTLKFSGTTPSRISNIAPPQYYYFNLVASQFPGFRGAYATWHIAVGTHALTINQTYWTLNVSSDDEISFKLPHDSIELDGKTIATSNISSVSSNATDWLSFDNSTWTLSGSAQEKSTSQMVLIQVEDVFADTIQALVYVNVLTGLFTSDFANVNATIGREFEYTLNSTKILDDTSGNVEINATSSASWLHYSSENRSLTGYPPSDPGSSAEVVWTAVSNSLGRRDTRTQTIDIVKASATTSSSSSSSATASSTSSPTASHSADSTATATAGSDGNSSLDSTAQANSHGLTEKQKLGIGLGISLPMLAILLGLLLFCCLGRRRRREKRDPSHRGDSPTGSNRSLPPISRPLNGDSAWPIEDDSWDAPRRLSALQIFKDKSADSQLSGYIAQIHNEPRSGGNRNSVMVDTLRNDGPPRPLRSWRRQATTSSDEWEHDLRASDVSLATIATNEIFNVHVVSPHAPTLHESAVQPTVEIFPPEEYRSAYEPTSDGTEGTIGPYTSSSSDDNATTQVPPARSSMSQGNSFATRTGGNSEDDWTSESFNADDSAAGMSRESSRGLHAGSRDGSTSSFPGSTGPGSESSATVRNSNVRASTGSSSYYYPASSIGGRRSQSRLSRISDDAENESDGRDSSGNVAFL